ncbi:MAG: double zinc ribbon domain-containing protein [Promethearchaeota archaeon]
MNSANYRKRTGIIIISVIIIFVILILVLLFLLDIISSEAMFNVLIGIFTLFIILPILFLIIYRIAGPSQKRCQRCNFPVSDYAEFCKNCGLELLIRCPNCDRLQRTENFACKFCRTPLTAKPREEDTQDYIIIQEGGILPENANFCPTCGSNLKGTENLRFCEFCGSKLT